MEEKDPFKLLDTLFAALIIVGLICVTCLTVYVFVKG